MEWTNYRQELWANQPLPLERREVLVQIAARELEGMGMPPAVAVGYLRYAAGDKNSPYFVIPGIGGDVVAWCDCLPDDFTAPLWRRAGYADEMPAETRRVGIHHKVLGVPSGPVEGTLPPGSLYKVQQYSADFGWVHKTRAGETKQQAKITLDSYRERWPSGTYRLVIVDSRGSVTVVPDAH